MRTVYGCGEDGVGGEVGVGAVWVGQGEGVWGALFVEKEGEVRGGGGCMIGILYSRVEVYLSG